MKTQLSLSMPARQRGAATLVAVLVLLIAMAIITITTSRTGVMEQKITGNDARAKGVHEAAEAGLEYAIGWAGKNNVPWTGGVDGSDTKVDCGADTGCPAIPTNLVGGDGGNFSLSMQYERTVPENGYIKVTSTAEQPDNNSSATAIAWIKPGHIVSQTGGVPPPMVMSGCMSSFVGTPDLYPKGTGPALITSQPVTVGGVSCLDSGHLTIHGGTLVNNFGFPDYNGDGVGTIWEYYFGATSPGQFKTNATVVTDNRNLTPTNGGRYWSSDIDTNHNWPGGLYGTAETPVIIVFEHGCPKPTGNTTIHGILFFAELNACDTNPIDGWGNVTVFGSLGFNGNVRKMNANLLIYGVGNSTNPVPTIIDTPIDASKLPGTWKDF